MTKRAADTALTGLFGAYASDEEDAVSSGSGEHRGTPGGVVLINYGAQEDEEQEELPEAKVPLAAAVAQAPDTPSAAGASGRGGDGASPQPVDSTTQAAAAEQELGSDERQPDRAMSAAEAGLPPELADVTVGPCDEILQDTIAKYLRIQREEGKFISDVIRTQRGYKNPDFLQKMVEHLEVDECGSNYPKEVFDPHGLPPEDYYDKLAEQWQAEQNRRSAERSHNPRIDFVKALSQQSKVPAPSNPTLSSGKTAIGSSAAAAVAHAKAIASQQTKKSKWDAAFAARR